MNTISGIFYCTYEPVFSVVNETSLSNTLALGGG
jgi:hypothetical protein